MPTLDYDHRKYVEVFNSKYNNRSTKSIIKFYLM